MSKDYISVKDIESNEINIDNKYNKSVYQIQGIENTDKGIIMEAGLLEKPHDVLIREFEVLKQFKCFLVSRLYQKEDLINAENRYQMLKIIICKKDDSSNTPIAYLCFNFNSKEYYISTLDNKKELKGSYSITLHFMEDGLPKYIQIYENKKYVGTNKMMSILIEHFYDENVLKVINKLI